MAEEDEGTMPVGKPAPASAAEAEAEAAADQLAAVNLSDADDQGDALSTPPPGVTLGESSVEDLPYLLKIKEERESERRAELMVEETAGPNEQDPEMWKPHPPTEECPVCLVPLPLRHNRSTYWQCCGMMVCCACKAETERALNITNRKRKDKELPPMGHSCAFCRVPVPEKDSEFVKQFEQRVDKGDVKAMLNLAAKYRDGQDGLARDEEKALELMHRAADLGHPEALGWFGKCFWEGVCGVIQDAEKGVAYWEDAAKKGDATSRCILGMFEKKKQQHDLAIKHFKLAAAAGEEDAVKHLWKYFPSKLDKAELEAILRANHAARDEMNSEERKRYEAWQEALEGNDETLMGIYAHYYEGLMTAKELNKALKVYQSGDVDQALSILSKCRRACGFV
jgi:TPR repeat protein